MSTKHLLVTVSCFFGGIALGLLLGPSPSAGSSPGLASPDYDADIGITEIFDPESTTRIGTPKYIRIVPNRVVEDGVVRDVPEAPRLNRFWLISIDGGRVQIHGTSD